MGSPFFVVKIKIYLKFALRALFLGGGDIIDKILLHLDVLNTWNVNFLIWKGMEMKKKMIVIGAVAIIAVIAFFAGWYVMFTKFGKGPAVPFLRAQAIDESSITPIEMAEDQLMALTDTEEQAQEIADLYGITLVSYEMGVAVYHTEEDPLEVIARGQDNGYPTLSPNFVQTIFEENKFEEDKPVE